jgi:alanine-glyoxylate transaminase/serine-glyoxylate transaminase/serine-pyruvate transaminase
VRGIPANATIPAEVGGFGRVFSPQAGTLAAMSEPSPGRRLLLGPGPSNVHPRVLEAMARPLYGHLDPAFLALLDEVQSGLRRLFGTTNALTLPLSGTGSAGMEACLCNLLEPGDEIVVGVAGVFGERMCDVASRLGAQVTPVRTQPGTILPHAAMAEAIERVQPRVVAFVHAETSTGARQPVEEIAHTAREAGALVVLDCVTSLAGLPVELDRWGIDAAYSGTQKCLSCPPGLSPASFSPRAVNRAQTRTTKVSSWYLDINLLAGYFGGERIYHHTAPISAIFGLHEGLRLIEEEGMEQRIERHAEAGAALVDELAAFGFEALVAEEHRLPMLTAVKLPEKLRGDAESPLRRRLLDRYGIEVGGGLGSLAGRIWRIGLMGENARRINVESLLCALRRELA